MAWNFFLVKFFETEQYATDFMRGRLYCNRVSWFKNLEVEENSGRADNSEGVVGLFSPEDTSVIIDGQNLSKDLTAPVQLQDKSLDHYHLFCLYRGHSGDLDLGVIHDNIDGLKRQLMIPAAALSLGKYAVFVSNAQEFMTRVQSAVKRKAYGLFRWHVNYYDSNVGNLWIPGWRALFYKKDQYSYQQEYRFVFKTGTEGDDPLCLDLGDLSDITFRMESAEINSAIQSLEFNGQFKYRS